MVPFDEKRPETDIRFRNRETVHGREGRSGTSQMKSRRVTRGELEEFYRSAPVSIQMAIQLFLLTGATETELLNLAWRQVSPSGAVVVRNKSGRRASMQMDPELERALCRAKAKLPHLPREYVLRDRNGRQYTAERFRAEWQRCMRAWANAGGVPFALHDLKRRDFSCEDH